MNVPPSATPLDPLPPAPVFAPGTPAPAYAVLISSHPLRVLVESRVLPGNATQSPATLPVILILNLLTTVLVNLNVKY